jgi:hypothetical protein
LPDGQRIVLVIDRRLGAHSTAWPDASDLSAGLSAGAPAKAEAEFTVIEFRIDGAGAGEGKASLTSAVAADATAKTLALEGYDTAPVLFKVTR